MLVRKMQTTGEYEETPWDWTGSRLVASSRSRSTEVFKLLDGTHIEVRYLKSGNLDMGEVSGIPDCLTHLY